MMVRLHAAAFADERRELRVVEHLDVVLCEYARRLLVRVGGNAIWHVLLQVAAERDVEDLRAAADREQRQIACKRDAHQRELEVVALAHHPDGLRVRRFAVQLRIEIRAAGEDEPVDGIDRLVGSSARRHEQRDAARAHDRAHVRRRHECRVEIPRTELGAREVRRDADDRLTHVRTTARAPTR